MADAPDPIKTVLDLLSNNWDSSNTDSKTPVFIKITDANKVDFSSGSDYVIAQRPNADKKPAGIGPSGRHEINKFNLDIRVLGSDQEQHFLNVIQEVERILKANQLMPSSDYQELKPWMDSQDLSDKTHHLWRTIMSLQIIRYNV